MKSYRYKKKMASFLCVLTQMQFLLKKEEKEAEEEKEQQTR